MKLWWIVLLALPAFAGAQKSGGVWDSAFHYAMDSADMASGKSIFEVAKPDMIVEVSKHELSGADLFVVTAVKPGYPPDLLRSQVNDLCQRVGVPARGLQCGTAQVGDISSTRATFATNGIIDRDKGILRIGPIVQAFAGAPEPDTVHGMTILFNGEKPTPNVLRSYETPSVRLEAIALQNPPVVEYRVQLLSQNPADIDIPDTGAAPEQKPSAAPSSQRRTGVDWSLWIPLGVAAIAAGVLVYFLTLKASSRPMR